MRQINEKRLEKFGDIYTCSLKIALEKYPNEYTWPKDEAPTVANKMIAAFRAGSYNHDGRAIKLTCKALGIKYTRSAIEAYLKGAGPDQTETHPFEADGF